MVNENTNPNTYFNDPNEFKLPLFQNISKSITQVGDMTIGYVTGYLARSVMKFVRHCRICRQKLICTDRTNVLIACRAYTVKNLTDPSEQFINAVKDMINIFNESIPKICFQKLIGQKLNFLFETYSDLGNFECPIHELKEIIKSKVIQFLYLTIVKKLIKLSKV